MFLSKTDSTLLKQVTSSGQMKKKQKLHTNASVTQLYVVGLRPVITTAQQIIHDTYQCDTTKLINVLHAASKVQKQYFTTFQVVNEASESLKVLNICLCAYHLKLQI